MNIEQKAREIAVKRWASITFGGWIVKTDRPWPEWMICEDAEIDIPNLLCADVSSQQILFVEDGSHVPAEQVEAAIRSLIEEAK